VIGHIPFPFLTRSAVRIRIRIRVRVRHSFSSALALTITLALTWLTVPVISAPPAPAPAQVLITPDTLSLTQGQLRFQFQANGGSATDFDIHQTPTLDTWNLASPVPDATVDAVAEGVFQVTLPVTTTSPSFLRVLRLGLPPLGPAPVFNELMADNATAHSVGEGGFSDWIELHNPHDTSLNLEGYGLSDDPLQPHRWVFPDRIIPAGGYLLVYAAGDQASPFSALGLLATDFALRSSGETVILSDPFQREIDRVILPPLEPDQSLGRQPDGAPQWHLYDLAQVTPGAPNAPTTNAVVIDPPEFSVEGGFHDLTVTLLLTTRHPEATVHFTTNGLPPTATATAATATEPLVLARTTVVRAVAVDAEGRTSRETTRTFLIGPRPALPVISIAADPAHFEFRNGYLFGMTSRVLTPQNEVLQTYPFSDSNAWRDREVEIHLEFFEPDGTPGLRQGAGLKVFGGWGSRGYPQKSLALFARRQYGNGSFDHPLFPDQEVTRFESLVLRNSGNDNQSTHQIPPRPPITEFGPTRSYGSYFVNGTFTLLRDALMQQLIADPTDLDTQASRPVVLYLNGEYWGLYNLREKFNDHHVLAHHQLPRGAIDLIEGYGDPRAGDATTYRAMRDYVNSRNMAVESNYQFVANTYIEIDNFIDYHLSVIYFQNFDIGNIKSWRPRTPRGRFRWMLYDQDYGFHLWPKEVYPAAMARDYADYTNMFRFATAGSGTSTGWPNAGGRTLLLRRLLANPGFRDRFLLRCADLLNSAFREDRVEAAIHQRAALIRSEIPAHLQRWSWPELQARGYGAPYQPEFQPFTAATWETNLLELLNFARTRPDQVRANALDHFNLNGGLGHLHLVTEPSGAGQILLNTLLVGPDPWQGIVFADLTPTLVPVAQPGFTFRHWITPQGTHTDPILPWTVSSNAPQTLRAQFDPVPSPSPAPATVLHLAEINYHSPDDLDTDDWIELLNPGPESVNLQGWVLRDDQDDHLTLLPPYPLESGQRVVIARSIPPFQWAHPNAPDPIATLRFGLGNGGDTIRLYDPRGIEVERVIYQDRAPWPEAADGRGSTLQRTRFDLAPDSPNAWQASPQPGGTPGLP
jgi:hypothetical protein